MDTTIYRRLAVILRRIALRSTFESLMNHAWFDKVRRPLEALRIFFPLDGQHLMFICIVGFSSFSHNLVAYECSFLISGGRCAARVYTLFDIRTTASPPVPS